MRASRNLIYKGALCVIMPLVSCASKPPGFGSGPPQTPPTQVAITTQPTNQAVPVGRSATFTVTATGTAPIQYQWSRNGTPIPGATSASYTTPTVAFADTGSTFQVAVSNAANSVTSSTVTLTAGPRAPALGDLRYLLFEQVSASSSFMQTGTAGSLIPGVSDHYSNSLGTPLVLGSSAACGPTDCDYWFATYNLPAGMTGLSMYYSEESYSSLASGLQSFATSSSAVVISLDVEPQVGAIAAAWVQTQASGFDFRLETVPPSQLSATVAADGAASRVVTAIGLDASTGMVEVISYGWQGDTTTIFETTAQILSPTAIYSAACTLANQGYIISAFGGNDTNGYALAGMRVKGDTMPRPVNCTAPGSNAWPNNPNSAYPTTLVYFEDPPQVPSLIVEEQ